MTIEELNESPEHAAADVLSACCGASRWVDAMVAARPFASIDGALDAADRAWNATDAPDWHEAFAHHPRIGELQAAEQWARSEQSGMQQASRSVRDEIAEANREYEARFGHIYIVSASGKTAEEMLAIAKQRLRNDSATELRTAADEQRKITRLRLRKLLGETT